MVTIINFKERQKDTGEVFYVLEVQSGIEMIKSQQTGNFYATAKKASIPSTFDENTCRGLIGTKMPGSIQKIECDPYEYTVKDTGEILLLNHRYVYSPSESAQGLPVENENFSMIQNMNSFSKNGVLEPAH